MTSKPIKITLKRSVIGRPQNQVDTVKALGLRRIGDSREVSDTPALRGMVRTVQHLLEVEA
ncbi:large subunit ribosomal protein L30 [Deinococcus humi]|jgi:large subunit ribosomal protein L30|uniref:Large ribosomal subunit protein uL30 n=1 Tax=Deinococcus humi TaxID=662880 RepID=A0A7W8JVS7_9DEIO|nr:50S ribosomal protein L30 [Deinococcus humi]MBB5364131.1 large subunit ribosomal protein L30 [Deinococcus humi]GGO32229.1 50S ribosomal protein L30 [Deinococcus humi]